MNDEPTKLERILDESEQLGIIGSPSSTTELALDILGSAAQRKLVGELALFPFSQDSSPHYALGQITEIQLKNTWHEDPTMRSLIRQRGRVDAVSERQDTHLGKMNVSAVFSELSIGQYEPSILGTVPSTGTPIRMVSDPTLQELLNNYSDQLFYLGQVYGSEPMLPMWFKHFGSGSRGNGEAYHIGIFGKTGSGKSVLAKMLVAAYSKHTEMSMLILDPQGEFSKDFSATESNYENVLPLKEIITKSGKRHFVVTVADLVLDRWKLFEEILYESQFFQRLTMPKRENRETACSLITERLRKKYNLSDLSSEPTFEVVWNMLKQESLQKQFYPSDNPRRRFDQAIHEANQDEFYSEFWLPVANLFNSNRENGKAIEDAISWLLTGDMHNRPILIVDLSDEKAVEIFWNENVKSLVIKRLLECLTSAAENKFREGSSLNTLVFIDEAHRLAPSEQFNDNDSAKHVKTALVDAVRTTRKYGLGWLFISQTLSSLDKEIVQQLRITFFGFGLGLGQEFQALKQLAGSSGTALNLYQLFRDPHSSFDISNRQYSFMTIGPVSPLSFYGGPLFLNVFNTAEAFLAANRIQL